MIDWGGGLEDKRFLPLPRLSCACGQAKSGRSDPGGGWDKAGCLFPGFLRSDRSPGEDSCLLSPLHLGSVFFSFGSLSVPEPTSGAQS